MSTCKTAYPKRRRATKSWLATIFGLVLSVVLLVWIFRGTQFQLVLAVLQAVSPWAVIAALGINFLSIPLRVVQWHWLLEKSAETSFEQLLRATCLGYVGNCVLPARGGEVLKAYLLSRSTSVRFERALTSVASARIQDLLPIPIVLALMFTLLPVHDGADARLLLLVRMEARREMSVNHSSETISFDAMGSCEDSRLEEVACRT